MYVTRFAFPLTVILVSMWVFHLSPIIVVAADALAVVALLVRPRAIRQSPSRSQSC